MTTPASKPGWRKPNPGVIVLGLAIAVLSVFSATLSLSPTAEVPAGPWATHAHFSVEALKSGADLPAAVTLVTPPVQQTPMGKSLVVPILTYHYIRINPVATDKVGFTLSVPPDAFAEQMAYLHYSGWATITVAQLMSAMSGNTPLPAHPVVLTFDDGHDDFVTKAMPILLHYGFVGVSYVVPGFLGHTSYMTVTQVKQADAAGMVIGAHTVDHVALARVPLALATAQINACRQMLEQILGHPVLDFAYPYGSYDNAVIALVRAAGYRDAVTTVEGRTQFLSSPFTLYRIGIGGGENLEAFAASVGLPPPPPGWTAPSASSILGPPSPPPTPAPAIRTPEPLLGPMATADLTCLPNLVSPGVCW